MSLNIFSALSINGGGGAINSRELTKNTEKLIHDTYLKSSVLDLPFKLKKTIQNEKGQIILTDGEGEYVDTIILNNKDDKENRFGDTDIIQININKGGYFIINDDMKDPMAKFNNKQIQINYCGGNLVYNSETSLNPSIPNGSSNIVLNCNLYINRYANVFYNYPNNSTKKEKYIRIVGNFVNEGTANIYSYIEFGNIESDKSNDTNYTITNYGNFRLGDALLHKTVIANNGLFIIRGDCKIHNGRISNGLYGQIDIGDNVKSKQTILTFEDNEYMVSWIVEKFTNIGKINLKESAEILLTGINNIKLLMSNNNINSVKFDGKITNKTNNEYVIKNNGIIYLENDFETEGDVKISNNDVVVSFNKDPVFASNDVNVDRYLNVSKLYYSVHGYGNNLTSQGQINDVLFELNSSDIEPDNLITITYLLTKQYDETYTENKLDEILRLIKFGLLKDLPYNPPIRPPIYPPKPKYQPGCSCFK